MARDAYPISDEAPRRRRKSEGAVESTKKEPEQLHDPVIEGIGLDLPFVKGAVPRTARGQGPFMGAAPGELSQKELETYYAARAHQPWRRPPRSHRPYGLKWWDYLNFCLIATSIAWHLVVGISQVSTFVGLLARVPIALFFVDLLSGLTHALFDGQPWLVPYSLRIGAGRLAPIHEHRDTSTICSFYNHELMADLAPTVLGETFGIHASAYLLGMTVDCFTVFLMSLVGLLTQVIHKHSHLRGHYDKNKSKGFKPLSASTRLIFLLQDLRIFMPHDAHRTHHQTGLNPCLTSGWCNWFLNPITAKDEEYDVVPQARLDQPVYDIPEVEKMRNDRMTELYGEGMVSKED